MAREINKLTPLLVEKLVRTTKKPCMFTDGLGLRLAVRRQGQGAWVFRYKIGGHEKIMGLGPVHSVSLPEARLRAKQLRQVILDGKDPLAVKREAKVAAQVEAARTKTFEEVVTDFLQTQRLTQFKNEKHRQQWHSTLERAIAAFGSLPMQQIDSAVVLACLKPIMLKTPETGTRLRGRIERVFAWAAAHKYFDGTNPASRDVLRDALPAKPKAKHHKAMPYADLPAFMARLADRDSVSSMALKFTILTAARTGEVIGAKWSEIDLKAKTWTIPGDRMKAGKAHTVPLSDAAMAILRATGCNGEYVFINGGGQPLSNMAMLQLMKGMDANGVPHGFRSTFSDWAHDRTAFAPDVIEHALAHTIKNKVAAAYRRETALDKRVKLMEAWADYCAGNGEVAAADVGKVVPLRA